MPHDALPDDPQAPTPPVPDCVTCGACCAWSADWPAFIGEHDADEIPARYVDEARGTMRCEGNRCTALEGVVGERVRCRVYAARPLVCREFAAGSPECLEVRARTFGPSTPP